MQSLTWPHFHSIRIMANGAGLGWNRNNGRNVEDCTSPLVKRKPAFERTLLSKINVYLNTPLRLKLAN